MALTEMSDFTWKWVDQADEITGDPTALKTHIDSRGVDIRTFLNDTLLAELASVTDGDSGADNVGMTPIAVLGVAATIQAVVEALVTRLQATTDSASGADFVGATAISGISGTTTQAQMESIKGYIDALTSLLTSTTDGSAGADYIGATAISGLTGATVQAIMEALVTKLKAVTDSASGADFIGATAITQTGAAATIQAILEALAPMTTQGDLTYQGASAPARLAKGTAGQILTMNSGATAPEWQSNSEASPRSITVGSGKDYATIQAAINALKKRIDAAITITVDAGTFAEDISITGFYGGGYIVINGDTTGIDTTHLVNSVSIQRCSCPIFITGLRGTTTSTHAFLISQCLYTSLKYCNVIATAASYNGFAISSGICVIDTCQASNRNIGILGTNLAQIYTTNNSGTGNTYGISAQSGSTLAKNGTQPGGTTAELVSTGGVIR